MSIAEKLITIAENEPKVYEAGQKAEYDTFWDSYQENGNRTDYELAFAGEGWTDETFKPKYDLTATNDYATQMFWGCNITDLAGILKKQNVKLITEGCKSPVQMFQNSKIETIPPLDFSSANGSTTYCFASTSIKTIERLKVSENTNFHPQIFSYASALKNIAFEGVIGTDISFKNCKSLTHQSLMSIINALKDFAEQKTLTYPNGSFESWNLNGFPNVQDPRGSTWDVTSASISGTTLTVNCVNDYDEGIITVYGIDISADDVNNMKSFRLDMLDGGESVNAIIITTAKEVTSPKTLTLHAESKALLTDSEKAIATEKGWTIA